MQFQVHHTLTHHKQHMQHNLRYLQLVGIQQHLLKITEMDTWIKPTLQVFTDVLNSNDKVKIRIHAALSITYIDQNLPEMKQLAAGATTKKSAAQEYVAFLEDLRTASDLCVQAVDKYNSGDINGSTDLILEFDSYIIKATAHNQNVNALLK